MWRGEGMDVKREFGSGDSGFGLVRQFNCRSNGRFTRCSNLMFRRRTKVSPDCRRRGHPLPPFQSAVQPHVAPIVTPLWLALGEQGVQPDPIRSVELTLDEAFEQRFQFGCPISGHHCDLVV